MDEPVSSGIRTLLLALGGLFLLAGLVWPWVSRYFGKLPGDLVVRRPGLTVRFPLPTRPAVSLLLTLLLWLFRR